MAKFFRFTIVFLLLFLVPASATQKQTLIKNISGAPRVQMIHSSVSSIEFNVTISVYQKLTTTMDSQLFDLLRIEKFSGKNDVGQPDVPLMGKMILLPNASPVSVTIQGGNYIELDDIFIAPVSPPAQEKQGALSKWIDKEIYQKSAFFPDRLAWTEPVRIMRGYRLTTLWISPIQFNPVEKKARIYYDFRVTVNFENPNPMHYPPHLKSPVFSSLLKKAVSNWTIEQNFTSPESRSVEFFTGCDYLIVTHSRFATAAHSLAAWKRMCGLSAKVVDTDEIGGDAEDLRNFIQNAYEHWDPAPTYVVFLGDAEFVPTNYYTKHSSDDNGTIGTDLYYTTVDGSDYFPDIISGRIPVDEPIEAYSFVQRLIQYEKNPTSEPSFYQNIVVASYFQDDDDTDTPNYNERDGYEDRRFVLTSEEMRDFLLSEGYQVQRIYSAKPAVDPQFYNNGSYANGERLPQELLRSKGFAWDGDARDISNAIERGCFLVSHRDHGSRSGWGDPAYKVGDVGSLENGDKLPVVMSINCNTGWYDNETDDDVTGTSTTAESFVEAWIRNLRGGAVGVFGSTRVSYSGYNDALAKGILDAIWPDFFSDDPAEVKTASLGEALNYGKLVMASEYSANKARLVEFEEFHYFGDPAMRIWTHMPETMQVVHTDSLFFNQTKLSVTSSVGGASISLVQGNHLLATGETNEAGQVELSFSPISSDAPITLVVRKENFRPYIADLTIGQPETGAIVLTSVEMEDENGNGEINIGEQIRWIFSVKNSSQISAQDIKLALASEDSLISIQQQNCTIPALDAGETVSMDSLIFSIRTECPAAYLVAMQLLIIQASDTLIYPLNFTVKAGSPGISVSPILLAENLPPGDSLSAELIVQNDGFSPGNFTIKDVARQKIAVGDTSRQLWLATNSGCGNVFYARKDENILQFSYFMDVDSATDISYFIYEGKHLTGNYFLKWHKSDHLESRGRGFHGTGLINLQLQSGSYYYFGASWADRGTKICRAEKFPPVSYPFGTLVTGTVNVGSMTPEDTVRQSYAKIFTFVQQLDFGTSSWIEIPVTEKMLLPQENFSFPLQIKTPLTDTLLQTNLIVAAEGADKDSLIIPVAITTSNATEIALNFAGVKDDENQDGEIDPGETATLSVVIKNLSDQPLTDVSLTVSSTDTLIEFIQQSKIIANVDSYEQKLVDAFSVAVSNRAATGHVFELLITAEYDNGKIKQLPFSLSVGADVPEITIAPDTVIVTADTFLQVIEEKVSISNTGYGAFPFQVINPIFREYSIGSIGNQSGLAVSNGCGNVYFFIENTKLQKVVMSFEVSSGGRIYFFVYESQSNRGEFKRIHYSSADVSETGKVSVESKRMDLSLKKNHFYYIGASWQGEMKMLRLQQVAPVAFQTFQVEGGAFAPASVPPHDSVVINTVTPLILAQRVMLGQGTWLQTETASEILYPGETTDIPIQFFANESDTSLTTNILIKSLDPQFSSKVVPVRFHVNATATHVDERLPGKISRFALRQNYPNPFNPSTIIKFELPFSSFVEIKVYNTLGQQIKTLTARKFASGIYSVTWDGTNSGGINVASGIYLVRFKAKNVSLCRKIILLR